jgi:ATP-dependent DNA ligase
MMERLCFISSVGTTTRPPKWIKPQLTHLVDEAPTGGGWVHEIKYDGYRMHARIDGGKATLLTRRAWIGRIDIGAPWRRSDP